MMNKFKVTLAALALVVAYSAYAASDIAEQDSVQGKGIQVTEIKYDLVNLDNNRDNTPEHKASLLREKAKFPNAVRMIRQFNAEGEVAGTSYIDADGNVIHYIATYNV